MGDCGQAQLFRYEGVERASRGTRLTRVLLAVCATVGAASVFSSTAARASSHGFYAFRTPSSNIICDLAFSSARQGRLSCTVRSTGTPDAYPKTWSLAAVGHVIVARIDNSPYPNGVVLAYGHSLRRGPFRCSASRSGLECRSVLSGHGFFLSRALQRVY
jgi:hypothetical protein